MLISFWGQWTWHLWFTSSRSNTKIKHHKARIVLEWQTTWELLVAVVIDSISMLLRGREDKAESWPAHWWKYVLLMFITVRWSPSDTTNTYGVQKYFFRNICIFSKYYNFAIWVWDQYKAINSVSFRGVLVCWPPSSFMKTQLRQSLRPFIHSFIHSFARLASPAISLSWISESDLRQKLKLKLLPFQFWG